MLREEQCPAGVTRRGRPRPYMHRPFWHTSPRRPSQRGAVKQHGWSAARPHSAHSPAALHSKNGSSSLQLCPSGAHSGAAASGSPASRGDSPPSSSPPSSSPASGFCPPELASASSSPPPPRPSNLVGVVEGGARGARGRDEKRNRHPGQRSQRARRHGHLREVDGPVWQAEPARRLTSRPPHGVLPASPGACGTGALQSGP